VIPNPFLRPSLLPQPKYLIRALAAALGAILLLLLLPRPTAAACFYTPAFLFNASPGLEGDRGKGSEAAGRKKWASSFTCVVLPACEGLKGIDRKERENEVLIQMRRKLNKQRDSS
jgi:hypothetical protein